MILVLNRKSGMGCTTLAYNISRLLDVKLYAQGSSYLHKINSDYKEYMGEYFDSSKYPIKVNRINTQATEGVVDIGSNYLTARNNETLKIFLERAKSVIVPVELGYEALMQTVETIKDLRGWNEKLEGIRKNVPIVIVINKLDPRDGVKDFSAKKHFISALRKINNDLEDEYGEALIQFTGDEYYDEEEDDPQLPSFENASNITITYLRHSYALCGIETSSSGATNQSHFSYNIENGEYFLDVFKYKHKRLKDNEGSLIEETDPEDNTEAFETLKLRHAHRREKFEFNFFRYLFFLSIKNKRAEYSDTEKYIAAKDFVYFRVKFIDKCGYENESSKKKNDKYIYEDSRFEKFTKDLILTKFPKNLTAFNQYKKLIKDIAYIVYAVITPREDILNDREKFFNSNERWIDL